MSDKILSDLRRIAQTYPTRGTQDAVIAAVDEIQRLRSDLAAARALLTGVYYMDPPDGGDVDLIEQLRRMADDARRYRWLTDCAGIDFECMAPYQLIGRMSDRIDAAIAGEKRNGL